MHKHTNLIHICMTMSGKVSEKVGYRRHQNSQRGQGEDRVFVFQRAGECVTSGC